MNPTDVANTAAPLVPKILKDGSFTLVNEVLHEHYHNWAGAFSEARGHYAEPACHYLKPVSQRLSVLRLWDVCFGLGYNSFVFIQVLLENLSDFPALQALHIQAVDSDDRLPALWLAVLEQAHFERLRQTYDISCSRSSDPLLYHLTFHSDQAPTVHVHIYIDNALGRIPQWRVQAKAPVDLIFHDAFSPAKVPDLWSQVLFTHYAEVLAPAHGCLLTYSLARRVKNAVEGVGLVWKKLPRLGWKDGAMLATLPRI